jgi:hypothetical protein
MYGLSNQVPILELRRSSMAFLELLLQKLDEYIARPFLKYQNIKNLFALESF